MKKGTKVKKTTKNMITKTTNDDRKQRGKEQRIFLIITHDYDKDILERQYEVMGTTGNAYTVTINNKPSCTCPDNTIRRRRCKHIYFVLTRIMRVKQDQEDMVEYSNTELKDMISNIPDIVDNLRVDTNKLSRFKTQQKNGNGEVEMRDINEDDMCPICLGSLYECGEEIIYCKYSCGKSIHKLCFDMYNNKNEYNSKCLFCFREWSNEKKQYINLNI